MTEMQFCLEQVATVIFRGYLLFTGGN